MIDVAPLDVAAILTALGVLVQNWRTNRKTKHALRTVEAEVTPNHGGSLRDAVVRTETKTAEGASTLVLVLDSISSLGHQVGEIRAEINTSRAEDLAVHQDLSQRLHRIESRL